MSVDNIFGISIGIFSFFCGNLFLYAFSDISQLSVIKTLIPATIILSVVFFISKRRIFLMFILFFMGLSWQWYHAFQVINDRINNDLHGKDFTVQGRVVSQPKYLGINDYSDKKNINFIFKVIKCIEAESYSCDIPYYLSLSWYKSNVVIKNGDVWQLHVRLKEPRSTFNNIPYDKERFFFLNNIGARGYVRKSNFNKIVKNDDGIISRLRSLIASRIDDLFLENKNKEIVKALVVGDRSGFSSEQWRVFARTGTSHLVAISGLHIGLIATIGFFIGRFLWGLSIRLSTLVAPIYCGGFTAVIVSLLYSALAGFGIATTRALIMIAVAFIALLIKRNVSVMRILSIALAAVMVIDPFAILAKGFWLSFIAVLVILIICRDREKKVFWQWITIQFYLSFALMPLTIFFFGQASVISPFVNLILVPVFSFIIVPLLFIAAALLIIFPYAGDWMMLCCGYLLDNIWSVLRAISAYEFVVLNMRIASLFTLFVIMFVFLWFLFSRAGKWRYAIFSLLFLIPLQSEERDFGKQQEYIYLDFIDIGQGLAVGVHMPEHFLLFDTGPRYFGGFDSGRDIISPYLQQIEVNKIDYMVVSHGDNDHSGGAHYLMDHFEVGKSYSGEPERLGFLYAERCYKGKALQVGEVKFAFINRKHSKKLKGNDRSCVLKIDFGKNSILLTGDITKKEERRLLKRAKRFLKSNILQIPHHGSSGSSSAAFIKAVSPDYAIYSAGYKNRYKMPKDKILKKYNKIGATQYNTALSGAISFRVSLYGDIEIVEYRKRKKNIWNYSSGRAYVESQNNLAVKGL
ncbi:MAG: DNA internalization-related competence protein ComEC/Rec2 [Gammaproteobacteria bacterium]|nr:MAG: DNA internalization-related competence protein ComEC/Rec2 [Gammaproteobacteria bacterium]